MKEFIKYNLLIFCLFIVNSTLAQAFDSEYVKSIYDKIPVTVLESETPEIAGFALTITKNNDTITNLGVVIPNIEHVEEPLVISFVQRKILELLLVETEIEKENVLDHGKTEIYLNGAEYQVSQSWDMALVFEILKNNTSVKNRRDSARFQLAFENENDQVGIQFPINIQILTGKDKKELGEELEHLLTKVVPEVSSSIPDTANLKKDKAYYFQESNNFYIKNFSDAKYYDKADDGTFHLVYSPDAVRESIANIFQEPISEVGETEIFIRQMQYGNVNSDYSITLSQLLSFYKTHNFECYVGVENITKEEITATVILKCNSLNYIHLLYVKTSIDDLFSAGDKSIESYLYAYIPFDNVANLYADNVKSHSKKKITY